MNETEMLAQQETLPHEVAYQWVPAIGALPFQQPNRRMTALSSCRTDPREIALKHQYLCARGNLNVLRVGDITTIEPINRLTEPPCCHLVPEPESFTSNSLQKAVRFRLKTLVAVSMRLQELRRCFHLRASMLVTYESTEQTVVGSKL